MPSQEEIHQAFLVALAANLSAAGDCMDRACDALCFDHSCPLDVDYLAKQLEIGAERIVRAQAVLGALVLNGHNAELARLAHESETLAE